METAETTEAGGPRRGLLIAAGVAVALAVAVVAFLVWRDDDEAEPGAGTTTTEPSTAASTTTGPTTTDPTTTAATGPITNEEAANVVWPSPEGDLRYAEATAAVVGFAEQLAGFTDPVYGEYLAGDSRSGEIEVHATTGGPVTTVFVRQLSDDNWWVLGASTSDIVLDEPIPGTAIDDPLLLSGRARAFEGTVQVSVFERGNTTPLGEGFVTGSGAGELGPFTGEVRWNNPGGGWGVVVLYTESAEDGRVASATAIPVGFIGGD